MTTLDVSTWVANSRHGQNLPPRVEDSAVLRKLAALLAADMQRAPGGEGAKRERNEHARSEAVSHV